MPRVRQRRVERSLGDRRRGLIIHFAIYLLVNIGLAAMNITRNPQHLWFYWVALGWGLGVVGHVLAFVARSRQSRAMQGKP